ncbi:MAG TPA: hypothetical protein PLU22_23930, partial [Polyangiaceae bacterium]|nr:hypothetical protein [Polyangiaceae bacterium]
MKEARDELVRIDSRGQAHPIGVVASQRMRARAGAYRLLPAPGHVVFMRYTGEDGRRDADDGAVVRLAGEVTSPGTLCDVLAMVTQSGWRGELVVLDSTDSRSVFFEQGFIVGALTTVEEERLGRVLYRFGVITDDQLSTLLARMEGGQRLGEARFAFKSGDRTATTTFELPLKLRNQVTRIEISSEHSAGAVNL